MIRLVGDPRAWDAGPCAVAIGVFDGVHLGHRAVLDSVGGAGAIPAVLTFSNHPASVLRPDEPLQLLTTLDDRLDLMASAGIKVAAVCDFDEELRMLAAEDFVDRYVRGGLAARIVAVGAGFRFGRGAKGTVDTLRRLGRRLGFDVIEVAPVSLHGVEVRSSAIRSSLGAGDVAAAAAMLGRPHRVRGVVVPGDGRGRTIGVPTANLHVIDDIVVPGRGVYAVLVDLGGRTLPGVANLGIRPTFGGDEPTVEVHLFDFDEDLYGADLAVSFVGRIRDERRFPSVEALVAQIHDDIATGRALTQGA